MLDYLDRNNRELREIDIDVINAMTRANLNYQKTGDREGGNMCGNALKELVDIKWKEGEHQGLQQGEIKQTFKLYNRRLINEKELLVELMDLGLSEDEARVLIEKNAPEESAPVRRKSMKL